MSSPVKMFYLSDSFGFTYSVFSNYTCQLLNNQSPFKSFCRTLISRYDYEQQNNGIILEPIRLANLFQCHWMLYQIVRLNLC